MYIATYCTCMQGCANCITVGARDLAGSGTKTVPGAKTEIFFAKILGVTQAAYTCTIVHSLQYTH